MSIYGQEKDVATTALARMNMFLHDTPTAEIAPGGSSTLSNPAFVTSPSHLKTFDFVVANPPFSTKSWQNGLNPSKDCYGRFEYGIPPAKNGDYAFLLHIIRSLKSTGKGAVILPHGVLFRGNAEGQIRKKIIKRGFIKGIIGLPANLFYGTSIPACIIVLDKEHASSRNGIFMIDASKGFIKDGNKNRLRSQDIHKIVDVFNKQREMPGYSRLVPISEIDDPKNNYNLNLPRYVDNNADADIHDLTAHLQGGIPKRDIDDLKHYWNVFKTVRHKLFKESGRSEYVVAQIPSNEVKTAILESEEYKTYAADVSAIFDKWEASHEAYLKNLSQGCKPKDVISDISEDLLQRFASIPLLDKYDVYQHLMNYWSDIMQDDVFQISAEGWKNASEMRFIIDENDKDKKIKETPDIVVGSGKNSRKFKADLIPPHLIVSRFYATKKQAIDELESAKETIVQQIEELVEEYSGDEGLIEDAKNEKGKLTKSSLGVRMKEIKGNFEFADEIEVLKKAQKLLDEESNLTSKIRVLQLEMDKQIVAHYGKLSENDVKTLVVNDKWFAHLTKEILGEVERVVHNLATRVKELEERYAHPMSELILRVEDYSQRVEAHLKKMGLNW